MTFYSTRWAVGYPPIKILCERPFVDRREMFSCPLGQLWWWGVCPRQYSWTHAMQWCQYWYVCLYVNKGLAGDGSIWNVKNYANCVLSLLWESSLFFWLREFPPLCPAELDTLLNAFLTAKVDGPSVIVNLNVQRPVNIFTSSLSTDELSNLLRMKSKGTLAICLVQCVCTGIEVLVFFLKWIKW